MKVASCLAFLAVFRLCHALATDEKHHDNSQTSVIHEHGFLDRSLSRDKRKYYYYLKKKDHLKMPPTYRFDPTTDPTQSPESVRVPTRYPSVGPTASPSTTPSVAPSKAPSSSPTNAPSTNPMPTSFPSLIPSSIPTRAPDSQECTGPVQEFTSVLQFDLEIPPTFFSNDQLDLMANVFQVAYQGASGCDTPGAFVTINEARINLNITDANGELLEPIPWVIELDISCRGCQGSGFSDQTQGENPPEGAVSCNCDLPTVDAYVDTCNTILAENPIPLVSKPTGGTGTIGDGIFFAGGGISRSTGNSDDIFRFQTVLRISVRCSVACDSYDWTQVARGVRQSYNRLNANNPSRCDPDGRVVTRVDLQSVLPDTENDREIRGRHLQFDGNPFTIVFVMTANCRGDDCNSQAVLFGNHQSTRGRRLLDISTICPVTDIVGCPTTEEITNELENWLNDSGILPEVFIDSAEEDEVENIPVGQPTSAPLSPSNSCVAIGWGDPHFVTFDGLQYDCQADGEVILAKSLNSDFMIQGRFRKVGFPTVTTGVAVRPSLAFPVVQVSMATLPGAMTTYGGCPVELYVNGVSRSLAEGTGDALAVVTSSGPVISVTYPTIDVSVVLSVSSFRGVCYFSVRYQLPGDCLMDEELIGILGSPNGDIADDWMARNGTVLPIPAAANQFFFQGAYDYCTTHWCLRNESESVFTYEVGKTFADFENCDGVYDIEFESSVRNAPQWLRDICGNDIGCIIDGLTLGPSAAEDYLKQVSVPQVVGGRLFNTGVDEEGMLLPLGSIDPHYTVVETGTQARLLFRPAGVPNSESSGWVWETPSGDPINVIRVFETNFSLNGFDPETAEIRGDWAVDNRGLDILLNGVSTGNTAAGFSILYSFQISSGFVDGVNTLRFVAQDLGAIAAFRVDNIQLVAVPTRGSFDLSTSFPSSIPSSAPTVGFDVLYENDFESPNVPWTPTSAGCPMLGAGQVNFYYGRDNNQFSQRFSVETFRIQSPYPPVSGEFYSDPSGIGGQYAIGMIPGGGDTLSLGFDLAGRRYVRITLDVSPIDIAYCSSFFRGEDSLFRVSLLDDPSGSVPLSGTVLDSVDIFSPKGPNGYTFQWTNHVIVLDGISSTNGRIAINWVSIRSGTGLEYGVFDNLKIAALDSLE